LVKVKSCVSNKQDQMLLAVLALFSLLLSVCVGCSSALDCGSLDYTQPGRCVSGVCQCGVGYSGDRLVDPFLCSLTCQPAPVPDAFTFLNEPNVTVTAVGGNLVFDVSMAPFLKQTPTSMSFLNPVDGSACHLMPDALGRAEWTQSVQTNQCTMRNVYTAPFAAIIGRARLICRYSIAHRSWRNSLLHVHHHSVQG
jgi:hypothetical protein